MAFKPKYWKLPTDGRMVLWSSTEKYYITFSSAISMSYWYKQTTQCYYNEVIRKNVPRKFFLDIDDEQNIDGIISVVAELFGKDNVIVFTTSPQRYHIVVNNYYTRSHHTCASIAHYIQQITQSSSIDMSCYSSVKCLRLEGSRKNNHVKTLITPHSFLDGLITYVQKDYEELPSINPPQRIFLTKANNNAIFDDAFRIREVKKDIIYLDRIRPSYCDICKRIHDHENAAIIHDKFVCWRAQLL
jgi:hypothetical protein